MSAPDHVTLARHLCREVIGEIEAAAIVSPEHRTQLRGEIASMRCTERRLTTLAEKMLRRGWGKFLKTTQKLRDEG